VRIYESCKLVVLPAAIVCVITLNLSQVNAGDPLDSVGGVNTENIVSPYAMGEVKVKAKALAEGVWKEFPAVTADLLIKEVEAEPNTILDNYGGLVGDNVYPATGFFYTKKVGERWWIITPDGNPFIHIGVCTVAPASSVNAKSEFQKVFVTTQAWAEYTVTMLQQNGFNGLGSWSNYSYLRRVDTPLAYTYNWAFMARFAKKLKLSITQPGHTGFPNDAILLFHPGFELFCDELVRENIKLFDADPYLLGYFTDNELPAPVKMLDGYLALDSSNPDFKPQYDAAWTWLRERKGKQDVSLQDINPEDRTEFMGYIYGKYFEIVTRVIRKYDSKHMIVGARFHTNNKRNPKVFELSGKYLDAISVNYYGRWEPDVTQLRTWESWGGKPVIISEFYVKGGDSGLGNVDGAGWIVPTQDERGIFYQNFVLKLLESKVCVGWHWFRYIDNDPEDPKAPVGSRDSNKGIVDIKYQEYIPLLGRMAQVNRNVYNLVGIIDSELPAQ